MSGMDKCLKIAVTGANGFIGTRTIEHLLLATDCTVKAGVRSFSKLARLAELPPRKLSFHQCDTNDLGSLGDLIRDCDVVIHCAYGCDGSETERWKTTVNGAENLVLAAKASSVRRIVHLGTAAVCDTKGLSAFDEDSPLIDASGESYESAKLVSEQIVLASGIESVSIRPTIVYGPWGKDWTAVPLRRLMAGVEGLPEGLSGGACNLIYIDDLADALLECCWRDVSGPLLLSSGEPLTWGEFYDAFRQLLPNSCPRPDAPRIEAWEAELYSGNARADIRKAIGTIGFSPSVPFKEGMPIVGSWAGWLGLVPNPSPVP